MIILINQQASAFGTDVSGQFFASPPKKFTGPIEAIPLGRPGLPEEIAAAASFLASDESSYE